MARWDEILTLPVQNPPTLEFSAADIVWSRVEGWRDTLDRLALIPFTRVNDFVRGESNNKECPTRFHVEARRRRPPEMGYKPKVDGILEYILYWCSFGPDDHRKGGIVRPSRNYSLKRKTPAGRPNTKRGCVCHFIVKRLIAEPSVALIIYNQDKHVDKKGVPCHGPLDTKAVGTRAMFAPYISDELRLQILSLLYVGVPVETIMQRHTEAVEKQGGPCNRDDLLTHRYVRRLERKIRRSTYELDSDDAVSIGMWVESHRNHIFCYEDFTDSDPFVLGIQTEWQLQQMIRFGNGSILASDSRFGTNKLKYPIYSILAFDVNKNAIPVAWIITPNFSSGEMHRWMRTLYDRVRSKDPTWKLGGFIVDDPSADVVTISDVFKCSVSISNWRVRHAWHKNLMDKCRESEMCLEMFRRLGEAIHHVCRGNGDINLFEAFMEEYVDCSEFMDYFMAVWFPRIAAWIAALKVLPLASSEVSAAIECYHHQLKLRLLNEKNTGVYQRADWLVDKLGTKVHSYYWLDEYAGKENFARYWRDEWKSGLTSWQQSLQIPDSDVVVDGKCAKVVSQKNREKSHSVLNPGSDFAICDCNWSRMGNLCKHVIKSCKVFREMGLAALSTSLFQYSQTLMSILHCSPHDSVIRDHAVALAVCVQTQLNTLFDQERGKDASHISVSSEQQVVNSTDVASTGTVENLNNDLISANQLVSESIGEVLVNGTDCVSEKDHIAPEAVNETATGTAFVENSSTRLLPIDIHAIRSSDVTSECAETEASQLLSNRIGNNSDVSANSVNEDGSQDDTLVDACTDEVMVLVENASQHTDDVLGSSGNDEKMNIDEQVFIPTSTPGGSSLHVEERCMYQSSDVSTSGKDIDDTARPSNSMDIDVVGFRTSFCCDAEKEPPIINDHLESIVQDCCLNQNSGAVENGNTEMMQNAIEETRMSSTSSFDDNHCPDVDGVTVVVRPNFDPDGSDLAISAKINPSEVDIKSCSGRIEESDVLLMEEVGRERMLSGEMAGPPDASGNVLEENITNQQLISPNGVEDNINAEAYPSVMEDEISANQFVEVQPVEESPDGNQDNMGIAVDLIPDTSGGFNKMERSSNGHAVQNMTLTRCSTLQQL